MTNFVYDEEPVHFCRDSGYNLVELITPENRKKARERAMNPNVCTGKYVLSNLLKKRGIKVIPDKMSFLYI